MNVTFPSLHSLIPSPTPHIPGDRTLSPGSHRSGGGVAEPGPVAASRRLPAPRRRHSVPGPLPARRRRRQAPTGPAGAPTGGGSVAGPGPVAAPSPGAYRPRVAVAPSPGLYLLGGAVAGLRPVRQGPGPEADLSLPAGFFQLPPSFSVTCPYGTDVRGQSHHPLACSYSTDACGQSHASNSTYLLQKTGLCVFTASLGPMVASQRLLIVWTQCLLGLRQAAGMVG